MLASVLELQGCYRVEVICPRCGRPGFAFISKKWNRNRKFLRIYHQRGDCLVSVAELHNLPFSKT